MSEQEIEPVEELSGVDRRLFMGMLAGGVGGAALVGATAAVAWPRDDAKGAASSGAAGGDGADHDHEATTTPSSGTTGADEMDAMHKEGIDQFLANVESPITEGLGAQDAEFTMDGDVKVFELTAAPIEWEVTPGQVEQGMAYNGMIPGPTIRATEGERIRIIVHNELEESTAVHWHGQRLENEMDGVPFITQPPIKPGETYTYEFTARPFGSHMYHSHHNAAVQVGGGLLGALLIAPANPADEPEYDLDYLYIFNDALGGYTINGKGFPATSAYTAKLGQKVRFRFMNEGNMVHPVHLHGFHMDVFARDGYPLPQPFRCDTLTIAPGERWDAIVEADEIGLGTWAFHCHILTHAESEHGMFGMVTAFVVTED